MGRLRVTTVVEYDVDPADYGVETIEEAAVEELAALFLDPIGTLSWLMDGSEKITVEVVE